MIQMTNKSPLLASHEYSNISKNTSLLWRRKMFACFAKLNEEMVFRDIIWVDEIYCNNSKKDEFISEMAKNYVESAKRR